ncbi:DnaJ subfamily C member 17 [Paragonimus heterotremus]|uniref:DnaJ subfamily C member 17 n=1 Tax=Paragonimus heterotremus TaxID=100268 RepID=A0A8J4TDM4_9TREM|nr:DnaJ subfamily C member 17 [Paragonimus heterotremus]
MDIDLYAFFGVSDDCSTKDVKRAYKEKARQLHPDKNKDNPKAKEEFQQLKDYYDILHEPTTRKEYDRKWKAKREAAKRNQALDSERRKLKEKLEAQEAKAKAERERLRRQTATDSVADQLRREWQRQTEQVELEARLARKRAIEEEEERRAHAMAKTLRPGGDQTTTVVRVKWAVSANPEAAACYTREFVMTCLSEYGEVTALTVGKRGTALADFRTYTDALAAVEASKRDAIGLPTLPLKLSFIEQHAKEAVHPTVYKGSSEGHTKGQTDGHQSGNELHVNGSPPTAFDSFETDILSRMANFNG